MSIQIKITAGPSGGTYTGTIVSDVEAGTAEPGAASITGIKIAAGHADLDSDGLNKVYPGGIDATGDLFFNPGGGGALATTVTDVTLTTSAVGTGTKNARDDHKHRIANQGSGNFRKVLQVDSSGDIVTDWVRAS